jgi:hypothetical protein
MMGLATRSRPASSLVGKHLAFARAGFLVAAPSSYNTQHVGACCCCPAQPNAALGVPSLSSRACSAQHVARQKQRPHPRRSAPRQSIPLPHVFTAAAPLSLTTLYDAEVCRFCARNCTHRARQVCLTTATARVTALPHCRTPWLMMKRVICTLEKLGVVRRLPCNSRQLFEQREDQ